jgi:hypothetical protein
LEGFDKSEVIVIGIQAEVLGHEGVVDDEVAEFLSTPPLNLNQYSHPFCRIADKVLDDILGTSPRDIIQNFLGKEGDNWDGKA